MLDFTSALYLGFRHPSRSLRPWTRLTTGYPAALASPRAADDVAADLAALQGCERAVLGTSTLHLFWDIFGMTAQAGVAVYLDAGAYPIVRWGVERAAGLGVKVTRFPQYDVDALQRMLQRDSVYGLRPLVVADGLCPRSGCPAPVKGFVEILEPYRGYLILDDTQALGILGSNPGYHAPYGRNGGGIVRWSNNPSPDTLLVGSLAKGFGVPLAVLSGRESLIRRFEEHSETRVHCSPPSVAAIHAAQHALELNRKQGDALRFRLARLVRHFRSRLAEYGFSAGGDLFPVQTLHSRPDLDPWTLHERLRAVGIRTIVRRGEVGGGPLLTFIITARHAPEDIDAAVLALAAAARPIMRERAKRRSFGIRSLRTGPGLSTRTWFQ